MAQNETISVGACTLTTYKLVDGSHVQVSAIGFVSGDAGGRCLIPASGSREYGLKVQVSRIDGADTRCGCDCRHSGLRDHPDASGRHSCRR